MSTQHTYNGAYTGAHLDRIAFPMGGFGAGMICLEGTGAFSHVSLRHQPEVYNEPLMFAALSVRKPDCTARLLEGPVPKWKAFGPAGTGNGGRSKSYGLPRFRQAEFRARFPFGKISLADPDMPVDVALTGWSPFTPGDEDDSSLPVCAIEYTFTNTSDEAIEAMFSFHSVNICGTNASKDVSVAAIDGGFSFRNPGSEEAPWDESGFAAFTDAPGALADCAWFRGGWFDPLTMIWKAISECAVVDRPPHANGAPGNGASLYVPVTLAPGESQTVKLMMCWYTPRSNIRVGPDGGGCCSDKSSCCEETNYAPWYAAKFASLDDDVAYWRTDYDRLHQASARFSDCFYDSTLPDELIEAVAANLTILKSPTCLRQSDGRFWAWEGCCDTTGCCAGTCTHVWNYAQAVPHLFPALERSLRETEFGDSQDERGHQTFRASLPIRPTDHDFHAASDGQLGGIMKAYREWRVGGDTDWIKQLWPAIKQSLGYCIETWDPDHKGVLEEPHHNTYDIEFWGPDGMCSSFYLGALKAATLIGRELGDDVTLYEELFAIGKQIVETDLFDGEYFIQEIKWRGLRAPDPSAEGADNRSYSPEAKALLDREGPKYQYGMGCISDGVLGAWLAEMCGVGETLDPAKVASHVSAVHRYNLKDDLSDHANPQRPTYAIGDEGGLLLCTWPKGGDLTLPFVYSNEVWTGIEYQVAAHLMLMGHVDEGLEIVRVCRNRYDGRVRNPFNEYECGHWYARAMSSYGMLQALSGARYDAVEKILSLHPQVNGDFRSFLSTATGYGTVGVRDGQPFLEVSHGMIDVERIDYIRAG